MKETKQCWKKEETFQKLSWKIHIFSRNRALNFLPKVIKDFGEATSAIHPTCTTDQTTKQSYKRNQRGDQR